MTTLSYIFAFLAFLAICAFLLYIAFSDWELLRDKEK